MQLFSGSQRSNVTAICLSLSLLVLSACGGGSSGTSPAVNTQENDTQTDLNAGRDIVATEDVYAFRRASVYADVLKPCVLINTVAESCTLSTLPYIGDGDGIPTVDEVMDRVLVSHDWMGQRFQAFLEQVPRDLLGMFSSATAVLLGSDVRPSFYSTLNGAIQIDPSYLWLSVAEKNTISLEEDYRSNFGADLQFLFLSRRVRDGATAYSGFSLSDDSTRTFDQIVLSLTRLIYHELAHASDYMPRWELPNVNSALSVYQNISDNSAIRLSNRIQQEYPLLSNEMSEFARVRFRDQIPTDAQKAATASDVGELMGSDGAISFYSYLTDREDLANLVDTAMMAYHFDIERNVGFSNKPIAEDPSCDDYLVSWGQRNRLADPLVIDRAYWAVNTVAASGTRIDDFFRTLPDMVEMDKNVSWCDNQYAASSSASLRSNTENRPPISADELMREQQRELPAHSQ